MRRSFMMTGGRRKGTRFLRGTGTSVNGVGASIVFRYTIKDMISFLTGRWWNPGIILTNVLLRYVETAIGNTTRNILYIHSIENMGSTTNDSSSWLIHM